MHEHEHQHGLEHLHHDPIEQAIAHHLKPSKQHLENEHQQQLHRELSRHHGPEL
jgi:hypothetical protein